LSLKKTGMVVVAFLGLAMASMPHTASAQSNVALKIVTVDITAIRANAEATKGIKAQLLKIKEIMMAQLQGEEKTLREANAELARKRTLLAPDAFVAERKKYEQRVVAFQTKRQQSQKFMNDKVIGANNQLTSKMLEIIGRYAEANQVSLVLPINATIFAAESYNISAEVLKTLNKELPNVVITLPGK